MLMAFFPLFAICALLCLTFYYRISVIMDRLKGLQKELLNEYKELFRLEEQHKPRFILQEAEVYLKLLEQQTVQLIKRIKLIQRCLFCLITALCSFTVALFLALLGSVYQNADGAVIFFFVFGNVLLFCGLFFALWELRLILNPIQLECAFVQKLIKEQLEHR